MAGGSLASLWIAFRLTADSFFVAKIAENAQYALFHNLLGVPRYIATALNSAEPSTLFLISMTGIISFLLAIKLLRSIRSIMWGEANLAKGFLK